MAMQRFGMSAVRTRCFTPVVTFARRGNTTVADASRRSSQESFPPPKLKSNPLPSSLSVSEKALPDESKIVAPGDIRLEDGPGLRVNADSIDVIFESSHQRMSPARLRDNCRCKLCVDPSTRQRVHTSGSVQSARTRRAFRGYDMTSQEGVHIVWRDGHESFYSGADLSRITGSRPDSTQILHHHARHLWDRQKLEKSELRISYETAKTSEGLYRVLKQAHQFGVVIIEGVPSDLTEDKTCELRSFVETIGGIRNTFYGETWDVRSVKDSKNVAYTSVDLGLHMDLLYFQNPPRFQALHCLRNRVSGGSSYLADSYFAAHHLHNTDQKAHSCLSRTLVPFEYDNDGHYLFHRHPVIDNISSLKGAVNWSPPFQGTLRALGKVQPVQMERQFYRSMSVFESAISRPHAQYEYTMREGDLMLFDNRRVLHARRAFTDDGERGVNRWLKGCYLDGEVVWDKLVALTRLYN